MTKKFNSEEVRWCETLEVDGVSNIPNRTSVPDFIKDYGIKRLMKYPKQWDNGWKYQVYTQMSNLEDDYENADSLLSDRLDTEVDTLNQNLVSVENTLTQSINSVAQDVDSLETLVGQLKGVILNTIYTVGSYYVTESASNPYTILGVGSSAASWEKVEGKVLLGSSGSYAVGSEGGSTTHLHVFSFTNTVTSDSGATTLTVGVDGWGSDGVIPSPTQAQTQGRLITGTGGVELNETLESLNGAATSQTLNIPDHDHTVSYTGNTNGTTTLPPYRAVNIWRRVS